MALFGKESAPGFVRYPCKITFTFFDGTTRTIDSHQSFNSYQEAFHYWMAHGYPAESTAKTDSCKRVDMIMVEWETTLEERLNVPTR